MVAWIEIPREACRQWRTNVLARRVWRRLWWKAVLAAVPLSMVGYSLWWLTYTGLGYLMPLRAGGLLGSLAWSFGNAVFGVLLNTTIVVALALAGWCYRVTFLRVPDIQAAPLSVRDRLWAVALPVACTIAAIYSLGPTLRDAMQSGWYLVSGPLAGASGREIAAVGAAIVLHRGLWVVMLTPYFTIVGLRGTMKRGQRFGVRAWYAAKPILLHLVLVAMAYEPLRIAATAVTFSQFGSPSPLVASNAIAAGCTLLILPIHLPLMCTVLRRTMSEAERELFTPEAVEAWEEQKGPKGR